jgi:hypothetical protein
MTREFVANDRSEVKLREEKSITSQSAVPSKDPDSEWSRRSSPLTIFMTVSGTEDFEQAPWFVDGLRDSWYLTR